MDASSEILIDADGRVFAHNLTPALAAVLAELNPDDEAMRARACREGESEGKSMLNNNGGINDEPRTTSA